MIGDGSIKVRAGKGKGGERVEEGKEKEGKGRKKFMENS